MNEELQNTLASVLEKSMEVAEKTGQWVLDMAPELIEQHLMWEFYSALFIAVLGLFILIPSILMAKYMHKEFKKEKEDNFFYHEKSWGYTTKESIVPYLIGMVMGFFCSMAMIFVNIHTMIFISVAPEIYLIKNLL
jgi:hypothetical protein